MTVYLIADTKITDMAAYAPYIAAVPAIIRKHGGEYLVRGGRIDVIAGDWTPTRIVLFRFPDRAAVEAFVSDPEYAPYKALRERLGATDMVMLEGVAAPVT